MPARPLRRPHQHRHLPRQPAAPLVASLAHALLSALRRALAGTRLERATCGQLRLKLLKISALVTVSVRRIKFAMSSARPFQREWAFAYARLTAAA